MDPSTTLVTFMLHIPFSTPSVHLVGSWDNFAKRYPMEKDLRRGAGQWRGVHSFKDITCDGDGIRNPKRNGGLKMGHDYWYYYELNDGTEIHNTSVPSTTSCPYLPGQPVNVINVPTEVNPLRERSASESAMTSHIQTMNPNDKFMTPRAPPTVPRPRLPRLNTAPAVTDRKRSTRSVSPKGARSPWSARSLFGLRAAFSAVPDDRDRDRGRAESPVVQDHKSVNNKPNWIISPAETRSFKSLSGTTVVGSMSSRSVSPHSMRKPLSRDPSPLRQAILSESTMNSTTLTIPDEIIEEDFEDDDLNFASPVDAEKVTITVLSPPPSQQSFIVRAGADTKPLPMIPSDSPSRPTTSSASPSIIPAPLNLSPPQFMQPRSHFSIDTISTGMISPTESHFSSPPSIYDSNDDEDGEPVADDSFNFQPNINDAPLPKELNNCFQYSLPGGDYGSEATLKKKDSNETGFGMQSLESKVAVRATFGIGHQEKIEDPMSALDELLAEMGYLGDMIIGK